MHQCRHRETSAWYSSCDLGHVAHAFSLQSLEFLCSTPCGKWTWVLASFISPGFIIAIQRPAAIIASDADCMYSTKLPNLMSISSLLLFQWFHASNVFALMVLSIFSAGIRSVWESFLLILKVCVVSSARKPEDNRDILLFIISWPSSRKVKTFS